MRTYVRNLLARLNPVYVTIALSLLLSWLAAHGRLVNRDGILYLDIARMIVEDGYAEAAKYGDLTFLPLLIAGLSYVLPLDYETIAKLLNAFFMAGACALLVAIVRRNAPEAAWFAVLVVLAMPAYNQYRNEILREYGFWFFSLLGFWYSMRGSERLGWQDALKIQAVLMLAAFLTVVFSVFSAAGGSNSASSSFGSTRVIRCWYGRTTCPAGKGCATSFQCCKGALRNSAARAASAGRMGASAWI